MTTGALLAALDLPPAAIVDRRVPKTLLVEHGAPTPADARHVNERIDALTWVAALKPATSGNAEYHNDVREYLEIAVLHLALRKTDGPAEGTGSRLVELVHRAVPYPVILLADDGDAGVVGLSAAHKRWSQGKGGAVVLDGDVLSIAWDRSDPELASAGREALGLSRQPRISMLAAYQGWMDTIVALRAARLTGAFTPVPSSTPASERLTALRECEEVDQEIARLRSAAAKEKQMARKVEMNLTLKRLEARRASAMERLS